MKKTVLLTFDARRFEEIFKPIILRLSKSFRIVIAAHDIFPPPGMLEELDQWLRQGTIEAYWLIPVTSYNKRQIFKIHWKIKQLIKDLKDYKFDAWLTIGEMQLLEKYLSECVLPKKCVRIVFWPGITYLMNHAGLVKTLLYGKGSSVTKKKDSSGNDVPALNRLLKKAGFAEGLTLKSLAAFTQKIKNSFIGSYQSFIGRIVLYYLDRIILPLIIGGKPLLYGPHDQLTQMSSGGFDYLVLSDDLEAQAHRKIFKKNAADIYVAQYPLNGNCMCSGRKKYPKTILSPLSGFIDYNEIPQKYLDLFLRDFLSAIKSSGAENIHFRMHPDERGKWYLQLQDYLARNGIASTIVPCDLPLKKVVCEYFCVAGFTSCALRDARSCCDYVSVVGFKGVSMARYEDPKLAFGNAEGIGWIEEDGTFDPSIFSYEKYTPPVRPTICEIVEEVLLK